MSGAVAHTRFRVRYAETDGQRIAHHAVYPVWFEMGRADLTRGLGLDYGAMEESGTFMVVAELAVRYRAPVRYDEELDLETRVTSLGRTSMEVGYLLRKGDVEVATGSTRMVMVDRSGKPVSLPAVLRQALEPDEGFRGDALPPSMA